MFRSRLVFTIIFAASATLLIPPNWWNSLTISAQPLDDSKNVFVTVPNLKAASPAHSLRCAILRPDVAVQKTFDNWVPYKDDNGEDVNF